MYVPKIRRKGKQSTGLHTMVSGLMYCHFLPRIKTFSDINIRKNRCVSKRTQTYNKKQAHYKITNLKTPNKYLRTDFNNYSWSGKLRSEVVPIYFVVKCAI